MVKVINFAAFHLVWITCVLTASQGLVWPGPALAFIFVAFTLLTSDDRRADGILLLLALLGGGLLDTLWATTGVMSYMASPWGNWVPPWILGLWAGFAMTINHSLAWLRHKYLALAVLAAVFCPVSYYAGMQLGALDWFMPIVILTVAPLSWAFLLLGLGHLNGRLVGERHAVAEH